jgi:hypothetical protein
LSFQGGNVYVYYNNTFGASVTTYTTNDFFEIVAQSSGVYMYKNGVQIYTNSLIAGTAALKGVFVIYTQDDVIDQIAAGYVREGASGTSGTSGTSGVTPSIPSSLWGSFVSLQSQYVASTTTAYSMTAETQTSGNGVIVSSDTRFVVASAGTYNLQFSNQIESTGGGNAQTMDIWLAINVDYSNTQIVGNSNNGRSVAAWNFVEPMNAGDYFELKFKVSDTRLGFAYDPANINPTRPSIPSVIVTVTQV